MVDIGGLTKTHTALFDVKGGFRKTQHDLLDLPGPQRETRRHPAMVYIRGEQKLLDAKKPSRTNHRTRVDIGGL